MTFWVWEVERNIDWCRTRGSLAVLGIGPFGFSVRTSDGVHLAFSIKVARWYAVWSWESE